MASTKSKRSSKPQKPDCKVWVQVGDELLPEYLTKPIEIDGVQGFESYIVVALGDVVTLHCQAKPGIVDEFVLILDGIVRACESRRKEVLVLDKALHANVGRGKVAGAAFRSDMVIQARNQQESRLAEASQVPSQVGTIVVEGWLKKPETESTEGKDGETLKFPTYEDHREWYNVSRLVNPAQGHLPPFEIGFEHANNASNKKNGVRERVDNAGTRNTSEWDLSYKFMFHYRSATEMHKLGLPDVPVRDPANDLSAEEAAEEESAEEATDAEDVAESEAEEAEEEPEKDGEKPQEKTVEKPKQESTQIPKDKSKEMEDLDTDEDNTKKKRKSSVEATAPQSTVSGLLNIMTNSNAQVSEDAEPGPAKRLTPISEEDKSAGQATNTAMHAPRTSSQPSKEPTSNLQSQHPEQLSSKDGEASLPAPKSGSEGGASLPVDAAPKMSLPGLKSAPASRAARDRASTLQDITNLPTNLDSKPVLLTTETSDEPMIDWPEDQPSKEFELPKSTDESRLEASLATPPPSIRKNQLHSHLLAPPGVPDRRASLPISSTADYGRDMARILSEPRKYAASSTDTTANHFQRHTVPELSMGVGLSGKLASAAGNNVQDNQADQRPASRRGSILSDRHSDASDAATDVANETEVQSSVKSSQRVNTSSSVKTELQSQMSMRQNGISLSDSVTPEPQYHTVPSPILGSPSMSHVMYIQKEAHAENPAKQVHRERELTLDESPSSQLRQEAASSFSSAPSQSFKAAPGLADKMDDRSLFATQAAVTGRLSLAPQPDTLVRKLQTIESRRPSLPSLEELLAHQKKLEDRSRQAFLNSDYGRQALTPQPQPDAQTRKRKADDTTGNGSIAESNRPRKHAVAPGANNQAVLESLRRQQDENERLEKELKDLREYNATLESIRELRRQSEGVKQRIGAEKARQAALEAELAQ